MNKRFSYSTAWVKTDSAVFKKGECVAVQVSSFQPEGGGFPDFWVFKCSLGDRVDYLAEAQLERFVL